MVTNEIEQSAPRMKNDRLKTPYKVNHSERTAIYSLLDWDQHVLIACDLFTPTWDETDHFNFACRCGTIAEVVEVFYMPKDDSIRFLLECPDCGNTGQRKIYLPYELKRMAFCQRTVNENGENVFYGVENRPSKVE